MKISVLDPRILIEWQDRKTDHQSKMGYRATIPNSWPKVCILECRFLFFHFRKVLYYISQTYVTLPVESGPAQYHETHSYLYSKAY